MFFIVTMVSTIATIFVLTAIVTSTVYFFVDHNCNSKIDTLYYVGIALGK